MTFQPGGRFPTVAALLDHVFLVERRHLARLEGGVPPDATGVARGDVSALFDYADLVRSDFRQYVAQMNEAAAGATITFTVETGTLTITHRRLAIHVVLHEMRHLAQLAHAARVAGHEPPGFHDYLFYQEA
jgi:uncharacterized damage-inducible protein DinB